MVLDAGFGGCLIVISEVGRQCCWVLFPIQEVIRKKQEGCAESLHCVTAGSEAKSRERRQEEESRGRARREGCVFADLVRAMNPPPSFLTHHPASLLTCKGHFQFKQYQTDRNKRSEEKEIAKPWEETGRRADETQEKWDQPDQAGSGKYHYENRVSPKGFKTN